MARSRRPTISPKLPLFDHEGWAARLVKSVRGGTDLAEAIASVEAYARDVRDVECVYEATRIVGRDAEQIRKSDVPIVLIKQWQERARQDFGPGVEFTDRKLARFLTAMYKDVQVAQIAEAVRQAAAQATSPEALHDDHLASKWSRVAANLEAMRQSLTGGGFVPVPHAPQ